MSRRNSGRTVVRISDRAASDLDDIEQYSTDAWGITVAPAYLSKFFVAFDRLKANPKLLRLEPQFSSGLYLYRVEKHFLVCDSSENLISVLAVIHTSMDVHTRLALLEPRLLFEAAMLRAKYRAHNKAD